MDHLRWAADKMGVAVLVSLHQVDFALEFADRIVAIADGTILFDGDPSELTDDMIARVYGADADSAQRAE